MTSWLHKQRKGDLVALAAQAGITDMDGMRKDELVTAIDTQLRANASSLYRNPAFSGFYERYVSPAKPASPVKPAPYSPVSVPFKSEDDGQALRSRRRSTRDSIKEELESFAESAPETIKTLATRTPRAVQHAVSQVPLPPSPAVVTDAIERQTAIVRDTVSDYWSRSGIVENAEYLREVLSSVVGVEAAALLVEAWGLQRVTLPWRYAFDIPAIKALGTHSHEVRLPDFFVMVTSSFWSPTTLWASTSLLIPLLFAYFFNLTLNSKSSRSSRAPPTRQADPLTFNIMKALVTWLVYSKGMTFNGLVSEGTVMTVNEAVPGGYQGVMIGAGIGILTSIYEAVLKK
ncbi:hypothetical protein H2201_006499 [Coniosporium apollinis]|uniref:Rho termination factor N-terminal domain-containing protein n=2 Tax=Coniosporium TaxID=2810619 RepID=A0ABQ9NLZ4_9PEZI|nr:hypothetical protein H2199_007873 [Cladosporium sp. JES 115]KAJ9661468.1 hypothetical protein H2201_006499 [Coniosporium apollinis]